MSRLTRKDEHIFSSLRLAGRRPESGFSDISLVHNALPEIAVSDISLRTILFGKTLHAPLVINAITGGGRVPAEINQALAAAARETGLAMAVGSQTVAVEKPKYEESFRVVRKENPSGLIMANVGAHVSVEAARRAVEMISADALQVHLNVPQEAVMREGDRDFRGWLKNISIMAAKIAVPLVVKEVGFGLSREVVRRLYEAGVRNFDVGGRGGTNFIAIEYLRSELKGSSLETWGITTAASLVEVKSSGMAETVIATGGILNGLDAAKALALGADAAGIAGPYLKVVFERGAAGLIQVIENMKSDLKRVLLMTGTRRPSHLKYVPLVITGGTREWLRERGIDTTPYARRGWQRRDDD
ncbi:MAG: type 2 isopentenyl-diphosphate Delta-isomerase [Firmicutes bacterium HGW-Firmicutes-14]|nr:MAG: type 2 isopentenyl-diphosphate Delta-isomerase [Firmicutes bacterium HGW-Firmicutes-14]